MKVNAAARIKLLQPAVLSLTLGLISGIASFALTLVAIISRDSGRLIHLFESIYPGYSVGIIGLILGLLWGFVYGYILGFLIAYLYTRQVKKMARGALDPVFEYDPDKIVNIIQEGEGTKPYTIAIVANPVIYHKTFRITDPAIACIQSLDPTISGNIITALEAIKNHPPIRGRADFLELLENTIGINETEEYKAIILGCSEFYDGEFYDKDPIFENSDLFWKAVIRCLKSFVNNELLHLPEIFPRLKIVVIYDNKRKHDPVDANALCETIDPKSEIIAARANRGTDAAPFSIVDQYVKQHIDYSDVIMVISGSKEFIRSSARFTEEEDPAGGEPFIYKNNTPPDINKNHPTDAKLPGLAALWAGDDRLKTPVHEFAHAMSSYQNGPIVDEYDDKGEGRFPFMVNKQFRSAATDAIPKHFAKYGLAAAFNDGCVEYCSDRTRADKEPGWRSYVPERVAPGYSSIMDITYFEYRFSKLVFDFMYERLITKINR